MEQYKNKDGFLFTFISYSNNFGADLFVSIHFNKCYDSYNGALGSETCVYFENEYGKRIVDSLTN